jgi:steroid delta-isomerase-like uncharacterized protein
MPEDMKKVVYQRFVEEVINGGDLDVIPDLFSEQYVDHMSPPGAPAGLAGVRMVPGIFRGAFPDLHFEIMEMVAEGEMVATLVTGSGTNDGPFFGMPATGKRAEWLSTGFFRVADGKIVEHWGVPDLLTLMTQLGVVPAPPVEKTDVAPPPPTPGSASADPEQSKAIMRHDLEDVFSSHDLAALDASFAEDYVYHAMGRDIRGVDGYRQAMAPLFSAFPDIRTTIVQMVAEGDRVAVLWQASGTHQGSFFGVEPTGKPIQIYGITIERIYDGLRREGWSCPDMMGLMQQIGAVPAPGGAPEPARA